MNTGLYILSWVCLAASIFLGLVGNPTNWATAAIFFFILMCWDA